MKSFAVGDEVVWESQSSGSIKKKQGTVVAVVPVGGFAQDLIPRELKCSSRLGYGSPRAHESYLVAVGKRCYWPRVVHLEKKA